MLFRHYTTLTTTLLLAVYSSLALSADNLAHIYELAVQNDPTIKAAEASYKAQKEIKAQTLAPLLPQVSLQGELSKSYFDDKSIQQSFDNGTNQFINFGVESDSYTREEAYSATLRQNLFNLELWFMFQQGKELSKVAKAQFAQQQQALILRTAEAYFNVLKAKDNLSVSHAEEKAFERQLLQTQERFDVGLIPITEVHEAQAAYDLALTNRFSDEGTLDTTREALSVLTGQFHSRLWQLAADFPIDNVEPANRDQWVTFAKANNLRLKASSYALKASEEQLRAKRSAHLPTLTASASYSKQNSDGENRILIGASKTDNPIDNFRDGEMFAVTLQVPIFTGGLNSSKHRQAFQEHLKAQQEYISSLRNITQQVRSELIAVKTEVKRVQARQQVIISSQSALEATEAGYDAGTRNIVDILNAQRVYFSAKRDYANARYRYILSLLRLKEAAGILAPDDIYQLNKWLQAPRLKDNT